MKEQPTVIIAHTVFDLCTTGPWSRALFALPPNQSGLDPFNLLTAVVLITAVGVVLTTDSRTLTGRRRLAQTLRPCGEGRDDRSQPLSGHSLSVASSR